MCTAVCYRGGTFTFGRTLDHDASYDEEVIFTPRNALLRFRHTDALTSHYAMLGMGAGQAFVRKTGGDGDFPLYYDGFNEKGLCAAGLHFPGNAVYGAVCEGRRNLAQFEFLPWILAHCASVREAAEAVGAIRLTDTAFSEKIPPSPLHWILADSGGAVTVESAPDGGLLVYDNPVGVLTNNPPFPMQMQHLCNFMHLSPKEAENRFSERISLTAYSRGMGAMGLPGDLSSQSRFVRGAFTALNAVSGDGESDGVTQMFRILGTVAQTRGCCDLGEGKYNTTVYTSCCDPGRGLYCCTTYGNHRIAAADMGREDCDGRVLIRYALPEGEDIRYLNG